VETVNESAQDRQRSLDLFGSGRDSEWRNRLIWGDKKYVLPALAAELAGQADLVYIDPPFATGQDFSLTVQVDDTDFVKEPSMIELKAYRDTWGKGLDSYLQWFYDMATTLSELLAPTGSIYVHLDPGVSHFVKAVLDEILGVDNFRNEIIWKRSSAHSDTKQGSRHFGRVSDSILFYTKSEDRTWNQLYGEYDEHYVERDYSRIEPETGRRYRISDMSGPGGASKGNPAYEVMGVTRHWRFSKERMEQLLAEGRVVQTKPGAVPQYKRYLDEMPGVPIQNIWDDIPVINNRSQEKIGYPTQKPEALLQRIIEASSNEGDLVIDCVAGSGTTAVAAERLGRRWIVADLGRFAIHTSRKRLLAVPGVRPFVLQNAGRPRTAHSSWICTAHGL